jgi:hypothetical protein
VRIKDSTAESWYRYRFLELRSATSKLIFVFYECNAYLTGTADLRLPTAALGASGPGNVPKHVFLGGGFVTLSGFEAYGHFPKDRKLGPFWIPKRTSKGRYEFTSIFACPSLIISVSRSCCFVVFVVVSSVFRPRVQILQH